MTIHHTASAIELSAITPEAEEMNYVLGMLTLGMLEWLRHDITRLNHVENILFNPGILAQLQSLDLNPALCDVVAQGLEIEDIQSLLPQQLDAYIDTLKSQTLKLLGALPVQSANGLRLQLHIRHSDTRLPIDYPYLTDAELRQLIDFISLDILYGKVGIWQTVTQVKARLPDITPADLAWVLREIWMQMMQRAVRVCVCVCDTSAPNPLTAVTQRLAALYNHRQPQVFAAALTEFMLDHPDYGADGNGLWLERAIAVPAYDAALGEYIDIDNYVTTRSLDVFRSHGVLLHELAAAVKQDLPQAEPSPQRVVLKRIVCAMLAETGYLADHTVPPHPAVEALLADVRTEVPHGIDALLDFITEHPDYGRHTNCKHRPGGIVFAIA